MAEELKKQAYCIDGEYCFCVTKAQFDELTAVYFQTNEKLADALAEVEIR